MKKLFVLSLISIAALLVMPSCSQLVQLDDDVGIAYSLDDAADIGQDAFDLQTDTEVPPFLGNFGISYDIQKVAAYNGGDLGDVGNNEE
jgi:hypothetical protein